MLHEYGIHPAHDVAVAANDLKHAIERLSAAEAHPDPIGLGTLQGVADVLSDGVSRYWWYLRPILDAEADALVGTTAASEPVA